MGSLLFIGFRLFFIIYMVNARFQFKEAEPCDSTKCLPPNCRCSNNFNPPGGLQCEDTPQIIMITFDDNINIINYKQYLEVFDWLTNPNGCPGVGTFFISHFYTNYFLAETMYSKGHELADYTVIHPNAPGYIWNDEINRQREILHRFAGVGLDAVQGFRAPFLSIAENLYKTLHLNNFTYDLSWPTVNFYDPPMYPYTLDYKSIQDCNVGQCPVNSYPGLWVVPNVDLMNADGTVCGSTMDACAPTANGSQWYDILVRNFDYHYNSNRAPFGMHAHSAWFSLATGHMDAMKKFLAFASSKDGVWILTVSQVIEWMKDPKNIQDAKKFAPWGCPTRPVPRCSRPHSCHYTEPQDFYMPMTCTTCPPHFPSPTDPDGN